MSLESMLELVPALTVLPWPLRFSGSALRAMLAEARRSYPLESCGALFGKAGLVEHWVHLALPPGPGTARSSWTVEEDHDFQFRWEDRLRPADIHIRGCWHSHPFEAAPWPSVLDLVGWGGYDAERFEGRGHLQVIVGRRFTGCFLARASDGKAYPVQSWPFGIDRETGVPS